MATIRDETTMDDGRRITYYYSAPAGTVASAAADAAADKGEAEEQ